MPLINTECHLFIKYDTLKKQYPFNKRGSVTLTFL